MRSGKPLRSQIALVTVQPRKGAEQVRLAAVVLTHIKLFLALSRTAHGLIDMATPVLAALLCLGAFPPAQVFCLGILTAFAGYTSVYALNDLVDSKTDAERFESGLVSEHPDDLDSILMRHPVASGKLPMGRAVLWTSCWMFITLVGALLLNPFCLVIFVVACLLEVIYCLAWRTTWLKVLLSGIVKTSSAIAAVYAVDPHPSYGFLTLMFFWLFFWEMGGQNIPNDWADIEEDRILKASTIPVFFGIRVTAGFILTCLVLAVSLSCVMLAFSPLPNTLAYAALSVGIGFYFLLLPGLNLYHQKTRGAALALFNRASYYPFGLLSAIALGLLLRSL